MGLYIYFSHECPVRIWGLTSQQRIERVLKGTAASCTAEEFNGLSGSDSVLILRGDYLFDDRLVKYLAATPNITLQINRDQQEVAVAAHVPARQVQQALSVIEGKKITGSLPGVQSQTMATTGT